MMDSGFSHDMLGAGHHAHERRTRLVVALTAVTMVVEIAAGWATGSMALLADGIHMATHVGALGLAAGAYAYARRHADNPRFVFGTGKIGDLAGFASALLLGVFAAGIAVESVGRILTPGPIAYGEALWVAVLGLIVNLVSAWLLGTGHHHGPDHGHAHAHGHADHNLRSAYLHVLADALTSVMAIAALTAGLYLGWRWMDAAAAILGALVIAHWSLGLLRDTGAVLVDATASPALEARIRAAVEDGDARIDALRTWRVAPGRYAATVELSADRPLAPAAYRARLAGLGDLACVTVSAAPRGDRPATRPAAPIRPTG
jgi:cation diffusion facilitator family transporter